MFSGVYQFTRLPFGLKRAPSYFQEVMATIVLAGLIYLICEMYMAYRRAQYYKVAGQHLPQPENWGQVKDPVVAEEDYDFNTVSPVKAFKPSFMK